VDERQHKPDLSLDVGAEAASSVVNEVTKAVAMLHGVDPMTAALVGGSAGGAAKGIVGAATSLWYRRRDRANKMLTEAEATSGRTRLALLEEALKDDRKLELLGQAIETAMREADERRVQFYGRLAASGVLAEDEAQVDVANRIFTTIASLDTADIKVLLHVTSPGASDHWLVDPPRKETRNVHVLRADLPELDNILDSIVARLEAAGLLTARAEGGITAGTSEKVTPFARQCADALLMRPATC
jgi:hypothetical protein